MFGIVKPYIMYAGAAYPHKNLERLIDGWKIADEKMQGTHQLVLVGRKNYFYDKIKKYIDSAKCPNVILTGFVEDCVLQELYKKASLYIAPSLYEGFALSALEAMARGIPIVSSNRTCFPEVLGEAALYFDPENVNQMADAIIRVLSDEHIQYLLKTRGKEEVNRYSWEKLARETLAVYLHSLS